jgi:hypothetical protein
VKATIASIFLALTWLLTTVAAQAQPTRGRVPAPASRPRGDAGAERVAVQPLEGASGATLRALVSRIVRSRGYRPVTSLPRYDGTAQYPTLAREGHLTAFVTGDVEEKGKWASVTFLVWNGLTGSVLGRWTTSAPLASLGRAVGNGFWRHLGPAMKKAEAPPVPLEQQEAPAMRIDASDDSRADRRSVAIID